MGRWLQSYLFQSWYCNWTCIKAYLYPWAASLNAAPNNSGGGAGWLVRTWRDQGLSLVHKAESCPWICFVALWLLCKCLSLARKIATDCKISCKNGPSVGLNQFAKSSWIWEVILASPPSLKKWGMCFWKCQHSLTLTFPKPRLFNVCRLCCWLACAYKGEGDKTS